MVHGRWLITKTTKIEWKVELMELIFPTIEMKQTAMEYRQEHINHGETHIHGSGSFLQAKDYESWLEKITSAKTASKTGWVDCSTYFVMLGDRIIGTTQIRHTLNDALRHDGGNIGYGVRPSERRRGYATKILALALAECRKLGIDRVLVTCNTENLGSAKTILKNGGVLDSEFIDEHGNAAQRYWITLDEVVFC